MVGLLGALIIIPAVCLAAAAISLNRARDELAVIGFEEQYILPIQEVLREARATLKPLLANNQEDQPPDAVKTMIVNLRASGMNSSARRRGLRRQMFLRSW